METLQSAAGSSGRSHSAGAQLSRSSLAGTPLVSLRRPARAQRRQQAAMASMGIGFHDLHTPSQQLVLPDGPDYGLSVKQMQVLGLTSDNSFGAKLPEVRAVRRQGVGILMRRVRPAASVSDYVRCLNRGAGVDVLSCLWVPIASFACHLPAGGFACQGFLCWR